MAGEAADYLVRAGRTADVAHLATLQASVQLQAMTGAEPHPGIAAWVEDLLDGHPTVAPDDFLVAVQAGTGRPVASLVSLRQDWSVAGVRLPVAQIELVGTAPEHRGNRLTDRLFAALHQRHAADGVPVQVIEGIPYFYRRLGYDYALANGGAATVSAAALPTARRDGSESSSVRPATVHDAEALAAIDRRLMLGNALTCPRDTAVWRYEIAGRRGADIARRMVAVWQRGAEVLGYLVHGARLSGAGELTVVAAACKEPGDWFEAGATMYDYLGRIGRQYAQAADRPFTAVRPLLDAEHPLTRLSPPGIPRRPRGWYARCAESANLLGRLQPLLRARWHAAGLRWPEPTLTIDTYGRAARLMFTDGELTAVTGVRGTADPSTDPGTHAAIPPGALLQLALGHRTVPEVLDTWPDCVLRDRPTALMLTAAFPAVPVRTWPRN